MVRIFSAIMLTALCLTATASAQDHYAVLITGMPYNWEGQVLNDSYWNDTFTMWKALLEQGYDSNKVYVLYADGNPYGTGNLNYQGDIPILLDATYNSVVSTFQTLSQTMSENDVLFVWTYDHGQTMDYDHISALLLYDPYIMVDTTFESLVKELSSKGV